MQYFGFPPHTQLGTHRHFRSVTGSNIASVAVLIYQYVRYAMILPCTSEGTMNRKQQKSGKYVLCRDVRLEFHSTKQFV